MKKIKKKLFIAVATLALFSAPVTVQAHPQVPVAPSTVSEISIRANILEWRYKFIDGKLYRRLFNTSTQQWVTEWELAE